MPVYKEGLNTVLAPTIDSVKAAIAVSLGNKRESVKKYCTDVPVPQTYELQGGSANLLVCEDGLRTLSKEEQAVRMDYYDRNNIGWVARPRHGQDGYIRKGRFKKASNLNFTSRLTLRVEELMSLERKLENVTLWTQEEDNVLYAKCLELAIAEGDAWASGNIRIGEYILLIDSDTRVPKDCFMDAAAEMNGSPEVGALQHCSGVMYVADHYCESLSIC